MIKENHGSGLLFVACRKGESNESVRNTLETLATNETPFVFRDKSRPAERDTTQSMATTGRRDRAELLRDDQLKQSL